MLFSYGFFYFGLQYYGPKKNNLHGLTSVYKNQDSFKVYVFYLPELVFGKAKITN